MSGALALLVDLAAYLLGERRVAQLLVAHAVDLTCMLGGLRDDLIIAVRDDDTLAVETEIAAMELSSHVAPSAYVDRDVVGPVSSIGKGGNPRDHAAAKPSGRVGGMARRLARPSRRVTCRPRAQPASGEEWGGNAGAPRS